MLTSIEVRRIQDNILSNSKRVKKMMSSNGCGREQAMAYVVAECAALKVKTDVEDMRRMAVIVFANAKTMCM